MIFYFPFKVRQKSHRSFPFQAEPKQGSCLSNMTMSQSATVITLPFCGHLMKYLEDKLPILLNSLTFTASELMQTDNVHS